MERYFGSILLNCGQESIGRGLGEKMLDCRCERHNFQENLRWMKLGLTSQVSVLESCGIGTGDIGDEKGEK